MSLSLVPIFVFHGDAFAQRLIPVSAKIHSDPNVVAIAASIYGSSQPIAGEQAIWGPEIFNTSVDSSGILQLTLGSSRVDQRNAALEITAGGDGIADLDQLPLHDGTTGYYVELVVYRAGGQSTVGEVLSPRQRLLPVFQVQFAKRAHAIRAGGITKEMLAPNSVTSVALHEGGVLAENLAPDAIEDRHIAPPGLANIRYGSVDDAALVPEGISKARARSADIRDGEVRRAQHLTVDPALKCVEVQHTSMVATSQTETPPLFCARTNPGATFFSGGCKAAQVPGQCETRFVGVLPVAEGSTGFRCRVVGVSDAGTGPCPVIMTARCCEVAK